MKVNRRAFTFVYDIESFSVTFIVYRWEGRLFPPFVSCKIEIVSRDVP